MWKVTYRIVLPLFAWAALSTQPTHAFTNDNEAPSMAGIGMHSSVPSDPQPAVAMEGQVVAACTQAIMQRSTIELVKTGNEPQFTVQVPETVANACPSGVDARRALVHRFVQGQFPPGVKVTVIWGGQTYLNNP